MKCIRIRKITISQKWLDADHIYIINTIHITIIHRATNIVNMAQEHLCNNQ